EHTCAAMTYGGLRCWGSNVQKQLGTTATSYESLPVEVPLGQGIIKQVSARSFSTCAINSSDIAYCWGFNEYGQIGTGTSGGSVASPTQVSGLPNVQDISAAGKHTCALTTTGAVYCWGDNFFGQLGDGSRTSRPTPALVPSLNGGVTSLAELSGQFSCAIGPNNAAKCWGDNYGYQLGNGTRDTATTPVSVHPV